VRGFCFNGLLNNDEKVASPKKPYPIQDYSAKTIPYFWPERLKNIPFGTAHTYIAHLSKHSLPPSRETTFCSLT